MLYFSFATTFFPNFFNCQHFHVFVQWGQERAGGKTGKGEDREKPWEAPGPEAGTPGVKDTYIIILYNGQCKRTERENAEQTGRGHTTGAEGTF